MGKRSKRIYPDYNKLKTKTMKKKKKLSGDELIKAIKEAQKDPKFMKEVKEFIRITTS